MSILNDISIWLPIYECSIVIIIMTKEYRKLHRFCNKTLAGLLNSNVNGPGNPGPMGMNCICNKVRYMLVLVSMNFFMVCFMNFMHTSAYLLLWSLYDNDSAWLMSRYLQHSLNIHEIKFVYVSDITLLGSLYSAKIIIHVFIRLSATNPSICLIHKNVLW